MKRNNFMDPMAKTGAAAVPRRTVISGDPFTNFPSTQLNQGNHNNNTLAPLINTGKPLLANRPVSAYVRQSSAS